MNDEWDHAKVVYLRVGASATPPLCFCNKYPFFEQFIIGVFADENVKERGWERGGARNWERDKETDRQRSRQTD